MSRYIDANALLKAMDAWDKFGYKFSRSDAFIGEPEVVEEGEEMRETTVSLISKEEADYLKEDEKLVEYITNKLTQEISERIIQALEANDEIILKKPVLSISEYPPTNSIEYRKSVDWEPLVRCKNCKNWDMGVCIKLNRATNPHQFCDFGGRIEDCGEIY